MLEKIVAHAREAAPRECCGLLVGTPGRIEEGVAMRNVDPSPSRFQVDPEAHIQLNRSLRGTGRGVIGAYHSHPASGAEPSPTDIAEAHYPDFVHIIVSLEDPAHAGVRAYRIGPAGVVPIGIVSAPRGVGS